MSLARLAAVLADRRFAGLPDDAIAAMLNDREARRLGFAWVCADDIADARALVVEPPPPPPDPEPEPELPPPPPPAPTVLATVTVIGSGAPAGAVLAEYAHHFAPGEVPFNRGIAAIDATGAAVPCQMDMLTSHADGSVAHASVALRPPALAAGEAMPVRLVAAPLVVAGETPPTPAPVVLEISAPGMVPWVLPTATPEDIWRIGPLVVERRYTAPVSASVCGSGGMRAVLDVIATADGCTAVSVQLANDACLNTATATANYTAVLTIGGAEVLRETVAGHEIFAIFARHVRVGPAPPTVRPDVDRLADLGVIQRLDWRAGYDPAIKAAAETRMAGADWAVPFSKRGFVADMGTGGARPDIGPVTGWVAAWLMSGDAAMLRFCHGQSEALAGVPWHYWDATRGRWLNAVDEPTLWADSRDARWRPFYSSGGVAGKWRPEAAHPPQAHAALYAVTGRRCLLDWLMAQAAWSVMSASPEFVRRRYTVEGEPVGLGVMGRSQQVRASAWAINTLADAALLAPSSEQPHGDYFDHVVRWNMAWAAASIPAWTTAGGELSGFMPDFSYGSTGNSELPPWQNDYLTQAVARIARHRADAVPLAAWSVNWTAQRFLRGAECSAGNGVTYNLPIALNGVRFTTWAALEANAIGKSWYKGNPPNWTIGSANDYGALAMGAVASLSDTLPNEPSLSQAWAYLTSQPIPFTGLADQRKAPQYAIVPRGITRG